jgi:hypothetical protein
VRPTGQFCCAKHFRIKALDGVASTVCTQGLPDKYVSVRYAAHFPFKLTVPNSVTTHITTERGRRMLPGTGIAQVTRRDGGLGPGIQLEVSLEDGEVIREFVRSMECAHMSE